MVEAVVAEARPWSGWTPYSSSSSNSRVAAVVQVAVVAVEEGRGCLYWEVVVFM